jgi:hypothetical protein
VAYLFHLVYVRIYFLLCAQSVATPLMTSSFLTLFSRDQSMCDFLLQKVPPAPCLFYLMAEIIGHGSVNTDQSSRFMRVCEWMNEWIRLNGFSSFSAFWSILFIYFTCCWSAFVRSRVGLLRASDAQILSGFIEPVDDDLLSDWNEPRRVSGQRASDYFLHDADSHSHAWFAECICRQRYTFALPMCDLQFYLLVLFLFRFSYFYVLFLSF